MRARLLLAAAALGVVTLAVAIARPATAPACHPVEAGAFTKSDVTIPMDDGVPIAATLYEPPLDHGCGDRPRPLLVPGIVMFHGIGGTRRDMNAIAEQTFARQGYAVLTFDTRGHGEAGGLFSVVGERELRDYRALFDWLGARANVDERKIGAWGISLGGGAVWRSLREGIPFAAAEVVETWTDLYGALAPQDLSKSGAVYGFVNSVPAARTAPEVTAVAASAIRSGDPGQLRAFAAPRSARPSLRQIRTPVLVFQGRRDFAFGLDQGVAAFRGLAGPKRLYIGPFGHAPSTFPGPDAEALFAEASEWFARFLKGDTTNGIDRRPAVRLLGEPYRGRGAQYAGLPPTRTLRFAVRGRNTLSSSGSAVRTVARTRVLLETFGAPVVRVAASGTYPHLVAVLKARTPDGREITVSAGGAALRLTRRPRTVSIRLISQVTTIPRGSRLTLRLGATSGDLLYLVGVPPRARATLGNATLTLPVLRNPVSR